MALEALASVDDLSGRLGRTLTTAESDRVELLLADASATVRSYTGQDLSLVEDDVKRLRVKDGAIRLPQRPVVSVDSVADIDGNDLDVTWSAGDRILLDAPGTYAWADVTYTHGFEEVPGEIVAVVCQIAGRAFGRPPDETGMQSESIGQYSYTVGVAAAAGGLGLLNDERAVLDRYRAVGGYVRMVQR
jgi:hypothetical protein